MNEILKRMDLKTLNGLKDVLLEQCLLSTNDTQREIDCIKFAGQVEFISKMLWYISAEIEEKEGSK